MMANAVLGRILLVAGEPSLRETVRNALEMGGGPSVLACGSGAEALSRIPGFPPDLIVLDPAAPGLDDPALVATLRATPQGGEIPVVLLSGGPEELAGRLREIRETLSAVAAAPWILDAESQGYRRQFTRRLPGRLAEIEDAWRQVRESGWSGEAVTLLHRLAHSLAGACGMFGLPEMATAARDLERLLKNPSTEPREAAELQAASLVERLRRAAPPAL